jgi:hypothetical protein
MEKIRNCSSLTSDNPIFSYMFDSNHFQRTNCHIIDCTKYSIYFLHSLQATFQFDNQNGIYWYLSCKWNSIRIYHKNFSRCIFHSNQCRNKLLNLNIFIIICYKISLLSDFIKSNNTVKIRHPNII